MQKEKYRLESDLKNAEIKLILLFEELILLKSMEQKDVELTHQLTSNRQEKGIIMKEITDITKKLKEKKKEIDNIKHDEEMLLVRFHEHCPEGSAKYNEIRRFYERITKKRRKVEKIEKEDADEDDEEGEGEQEEEDEDQGDDEDEDPAISGLSQEDFKIDEIEKLRDERLQLYDSKEKIGLYITELEGNRKRMEANEKRINQELGETEEEIKDFQKEKMAKLNQLDVSVVLKIKQIQNMSSNGQAYENWQKIRQQKVDAQIKAVSQDDNLAQDEKEQMINELRTKFVAEDDWRGFFLPKDLSNSVLFTRAQLVNLIERKRELDVEIANLKKQQAEAKAQESQKRKEINENKKIRNEKEREYNERQMLRFGNLIDLDSLEVSGPSQAVLDKKLEFERTEKKTIRDEEEKEAELAQIQRELTENIHKNTELLNMIREEGEHQLELNKKLDSTNKAIFVDDDNEEKKRMQDLKEHFKQKLEMQAKEIDILKTEINLYKRKGGHIYTKVTTNRRVAHLNNDN